jgi:ParB family transcriptional regulator, chromosome partitioning protein
MSNSNIFVKESFNKKEVKVKEQKSESGTDIEVLLSEAMALISASGGEQIFQIPVGMIRPSRFQPRKIFDTKTMAELRESIKEKGLLQPITVFKLDLDELDLDDEKVFEIIGGECRWRVHMELGLPTIASIIKKVTEKEAITLVDAENRHRSDLKFMEDLEIIMTHFQYYDTVEEVAKHVAKDRSVISKFRKIHKAITLCEEFQRWFAADMANVTFSTALSFSDIAPALLSLKKSNKHEWERISKRIAKSLEKAKKGAIKGGAMLYNREYLTNYFSKERDNKSYDKEKHKMFFETDSEYVLTVRAPKEGENIDHSEAIAALKQFIAATNIQI